MKTFSLVLLCAILGLSAAIPQWTTVDHEIRDEHAVSFKVSLTQQNMDTLDALFWQISDPNSPMFGEHLTNEQIADMISLPNEDIEKVESFLTKDSGKVCDVITRRSVHSDHIFVDTCVGQAQIIFPNLTFAVYQKEGYNGLLLRSAVLLDIAHNMHFLGVPQELHSLILNIQGLTETPVHLTTAGAAVDPSNPWSSQDKELTVNDMITYFGINYDGIDADSYTADEGQVRAGVIEFNGAAFSPSELASFQSKYGTPNNPIAKIIGTEETFEESVEASLDVQTLTTLGGKIVVWDFVFGATASFEDVVETLMSTSGAPRVLSCSWGGTDSSFTQSQANAVNNAFMKLGAAGYTFLIASGDSGPTESASCNTYDPQFPAGSAYVLAVGGTKLDSASNVEGCWMHSSGGFSGLVSRPSYQESAVSAYLANTTLPPNAGGAVYNTTGRAYPDVAAFGAYEPVYADGEYQPVGGTSGACPQFAAIMTLINVHRYQNGLGALGSVNQTLYGLSGGIGFDVTVGQTYATNRSGACGSKYLPGWNAATGWDATTGLGSPRFSTLLNALLNVPGEAGKRHHHKRHHKKHHRDEFLPVE